MKISKLSTNGRVTIPAALRKKYGLSPGRKVKFELEEDGVLIIPLATPEEIKANAGILRMKGKLLKSLMEEKPSRSASGGKREREL